MIPKVSFINSGNPLEIDLNQPVPTREEMYATFRRMGEIEDRLREIDNSAARHWHQLQIACLNQEGRRAARPQYRKKSKA